MTALDARSRTALAARAVLAVARLAQFGFNPHQRRGPDGRFIKMGAGERRARASRSGRGKPAGPKVGAVAAENPDQRAARTGERAFERSMASDRIYTRFRTGEWFERYGDESNRVPEGVRDYFANSERINAQLRAGKLDPGTQELVDQVDEAMEYTETKQPLLVYRGVSRDALGGSGVGDTVTDPGYWSTTMDPEQARKFARSANSVTMHIEIPAGTSVLAENMTETGVLLPRGSTVRILAVDGDTVHAALVPPEPHRDPVPASIPLGTPHGHARRVADLERRVETGVAGRETISDSSMGLVQLVTLADGTQAIYKQATEPHRHPNGSVWSTVDQTDAEELSSVLANALGVRAPAVLRDSNDGVYMELVDGQTAIQKYPDESRVDRTAPPDWVMNSGEAVKIGLLDVLADNPDRHSGNWMLDAEDNIHGIDHGLAFGDWQPYGSSAAVSPFARRFFVDLDGANRPDNPLTGQDVETVRAQLEQVRPQFEARGRGAWVDRMLERLAVVARSARGETDVFQ
jgi:hypothetical protein